VLAYAVESYGAFGEQAMEIIQKIRNTYQSSHPDGDFNQPLHRRLVQHLGVALQKGNAVVARAGALRARQVAMRLVQH